MCNGIIIAIRKHICADEALSSAFIAVRIEESFDNRIIIAALEIVEAGVGVVVVASVAEGVHGCQLAVGGEDSTPGIVGVGGLYLAALVVDLHNVALRVEDVVVGAVARQACVPVPPHGEGLAAFVIEEVQAADKCAGGLVRHKLPHNLAVLRHILVLLIACDFCGANAVHIVSVADTCAAFFQAAQAPSLRPCQRGIDCAVVPIRRVAAAVVGDTFLRAVVRDGGQQIDPARVVVGVGNRPAVADRAGDISRCVVGVVDELRAAVAIGHFSKSAFGIVAICDVSYAVIARADNSVYSDSHRLSSVRRIRASS